MTIDTLPQQRLDIAKGQDCTLQVRVLAPETVVLNADALAGASTLTIRPLDYALASGDKLLFGKSTVVTLSGAAAAGVTSLSVSAIAGPLRAGDAGQKIRDLTGYAITLEVLSNRSDATPHISRSCNVLTQTGDDRGHVQFVLVEADTSSLEAKSYYWTAWRRNAGSMRPQAEGTLVLSERGFL